MVSRTEKLSNLLSNLVFLSFFSVNCSVWEKVRQALEVRKMLRIHFKRVVSVVYPSMLLSFCHFYYYWSYYLWSCCCCLEWETKSRLMRPARRKAWRRGPTDPSPGGTGDLHFWHRNRYLRAVNKTTI